VQELTVQGRRTALQYDVTVSGEDRRFAQSTQDLLGIVDDVAGLLQRTLTDQKAVGVLEGIGAELMAQEWSMRRLKYGEANVGALGAARLKEIEGIVKEIRALGGDENAGAEVRGTLVVLATPSKSVQIDFGPKGFSMLRGRKAPHITEFRGLTRVERAAYARALIEVAQMPGNEFFVEQLAQIPGFTRCAG
jgi:hypothetical protein